MTQKRKLNSDCEDNEPKHNLFSKDLNAVHTVSFSPQFRQRDLRLIEVNEDIIKSINEGEKLTVIGEPKREAVFCTSNKTFAIKKVETSNSILLVPPSKDSNFFVSGICSDYYELKQVEGKLDKLHDILKLCEYKGITDEIMHPPIKENLHTLQELRAITPASQKEFDDALQNLDIVEINGFVRLLSRSALLEYSESVFNYIIESDLTIDNIDENLCIAGIPKDSDPLILRRVLASLGECEVSSDGRNIWNLDKRKVLRMSAHIIFSNHSSSKLSVEEFLSLWSARSPVADNVVPLAESLLRGVALKVSSSDSKASSPAFLYVPLELLPKDIGGRLQHLFSKQPKLSKEMIEPYLEDLVAPQKLEETLLKHCRVVDNFYLLNQ